MGSLGRKLFAIACAVVHISEVCRHACTSIATCMSLTGFECYHALGLKMKPPIIIMCSMCHKHAPCSSAPLFP